MDSPRYYPTPDELLALGFFEGYGELWICEGTNAAEALIDWDESGTYGYISVAEKITHATEINSLADITQLIASAKAPF